jgi:Trk-type K+ transport system membrane component
MYISVYPVVVSLRSSNIFLKPTPPIHEIEHELQRLFARDTAWLFFAFLLISATETNSLDDPLGTGNLPDPRFNMFAVFFEIVSAYGNVGLSVGYPGTVTSFSGRWHPFSKVVLCGVMYTFFHHSHKSRYLGRHRGLPQSVDRALQLDSNTSHSPNE